MSTTTTNVHFDDPPSSSSSQEDGQYHDGSGPEWIPRESRPPKPRFPPLKPKPVSKPVVKPSHFYQLPFEKEKKLRGLYEELDMDGDGRIDIKDLTSALRQQMPNVPSSRSSTYAEQIMERADRSQDQMIDFAEFVHYVLEHEMKLRVVFRDMDRNKDGFIDIQEIRAYCKELGLPLSDPEAARIVDEMDMKGTATIDLEEFQNYLLFHPSADPLAIAKFWRHNLVIDIGEDSLIPEDFTGEEIQKGIWWRHLVAGGVAGAVSRTFTAPLDRLKVFLQVHASSRNTFRVRTGFQYLLKEGGFKSLWRGNGINVIKIGPESAIKFMAYEHAKRLIKKLTGSEELSVGQRFIAGSIAGSVAQTTIYPMEVLKTRLALRRTGELNKGLIDTAYKLYKVEGLRTFYRGYVPNCIGIIPYAGIDLAIYETLKRYYISTHEVKEPGVLALLACGTISSTCGQLSSYPLALVRTRLQAIVTSTTNQPQIDTMLGQFESILRSEGFTGLYRGITPNFMKVLPAVGISYVVYETLRKQLGASMS